MSAIFGKAATKGFLLRLKEQLSFIERGLEILKMKRDHLAGEVNRLLSELEKLAEADRKLMEAYEEAKKAMVTVGLDEFESQANCVTDMHVDVRAISQMGVLVPEVRVAKGPDLTNIPNMAVHSAAKKLLEAFMLALKKAEAESQLEKIAYDLMVTNRKVNSLEKVVIPDLRSQIRYVENRLEEEMIEEFFRVKKVREKMRGRKL